MPRRSCPNCARRLPYAGRRCRHCGWVTLVGPGAAPERPRRRLAAWTVAVVAILLAVGGYLYE
ncbi:MAG TPA: zinc ribbon domain-containing protein, partial [Longimicrobiaceae bacterium]|nr:zinc ribbon domain-containing protein [Longimicrobiaceae bacterium]